jgi:hypothetical protein
MVAFINPFMIPIAAAVIGFNYLRQLLQPEVTPTTPVADPYTPPFTGGQCVKPYDVYITATYPFPSAINGVEQYAGRFVGSINISEFSDDNSPLYGISVRYNSGANGILAFQTTAKKVTLNSSRVVAVDGVDNCGNLPNPNPSRPVSEDGLADNLAPNIDNDETLVQGAPIVAIPTLAAILAAIRTAVAAAANALEAIALIMDALKAIGDVLDKIKEWIDEQEKDDEGKKSLSYHPYGSIRKDGFLRLYPNGEYEGYEPVYIDLQLLSIPIGYGRYFGNLSPNFYKFKPLGYISFVSPTFGVLETREIEFSRVSLSVPENAYGFFYHLGLEDAIRANVGLFYLKNEEED